MVSHRSSISLSATRTHSNSFSDGSRHDILDEEERGRHEKFQVSLCEGRNWKEVEYSSNFLQLPSPSTHAIVTTSYSITTVQLIQRGHKIDLRPDSPNPQQPLSHASPRRFLCPRPARGVSHYDRDENYAKLTDLRRSIASTPERNDVSACSFVTPVVSAAKIIVHRHEPRAGFRASRMDDNSPVPVLRFLDIPAFSSVSTPPIVVSSSGYVTSFAARIRSSNS